MSKQSILSSIFISPFIFKLFIKKYVSFCSVLFSQWDYFTPAYCTNQKLKLLNDLIDVIDLNLVKV